MRKLVIRYKKNQLCVFLLCIGAFVLPSIVRTSLLSVSWMEVNIIGYFSLLMMFNSVRSCTTLKQYCNTNVYISWFKSFVFFGLAISFLTVTFYRGDYQTCLLAAVTILLPYIFIDMDFKTSQVTVDWANIWIMFLRVCSIVMIVGGLIDILTDYSVSVFFADLYDVDSLHSLVTANRLVSYMGHSLLSGEIFLIQYISSYLYQKIYLKGKENFIWLLISILGCILTGSKTCVVLLLIGVVVFHSNWKERRYIPILLIGILVLYWTGFMDVFLERLFTSIETGNITTNRNSSLTALIGSGTIKFSWFKGQTIDYSWQMVAALEYPVLRWAYQYGIMVSVCLTLVAFVIPLMRFIVYKASWKYIFGILLIIVDVNTYNGLSLARDYTLIYCLTIMFIYNMAIHPKGDTD